jgi:hypothetical protein
MSAAAGALLADVAGKLADALAEIEIMSNDMLCDLDPADPPKYAPPDLVSAWRVALRNLDGLAAIVGEAGATADAGAQALGELPTSSGWGAAPDCRDRIRAARHQEVRDVAAN